jgi:hypothetical protein
MNPSIPTSRVSPPVRLSIAASDPRAHPKVTAIGSLRTSTLWTLSTGRSMDDVPVAGSVTLKPSKSSGASWGRMPSMRSRPSEPRTTDGSRGRASRACGVAIGSRSTVVPERWVAMTARVGESTPAADATTSMLSLAPANGRTIRAASAHGTDTLAKPGHDAAMRPPRGHAANVKLPSAPVTADAIREASSSICTVTPGSGADVGSTTVPRMSS